MIVSVENLRYWLEYLDIIKPYTQQSRFLVNIGNWYTVSKISFMIIKSHDL